MKNKTATQDKSGSLTHIHRNSAAIHSVKFSNAKSSKLTVWYIIALFITVLELCIISLLVLVRIPHYHHFQAESTRYHGLSYFLA